MAVTESCRSRLRYADALPEFLCEPDEKSLWATGVAESIRLIVMALPRIVYRMGHYRTCAPIHRYLRDRIVQVISLKCPNASIASSLDVYGVFAKGQRRRTGGRAKYESAKRARVKVEAGAVSAMSPRRDLNFRGVRETRFTTCKGRPTRLRSICNASNVNGHDAGRHVLVLAIPSRIAASSTARLMLRSVLNLMQYPVTLALPSSPP